MAPAGTTATEDSSQTMSTNQSKPANISKLSSQKKFHVLFAICMTLALGIVGGGNLPLPGAFASTGVIAATLLIVLVGLANAYTSDMLCWQAYYVGRVDYETLGFAIGGEVWQFIVEASIVGLLFGTLVALIQQTGEVAGYGISLLWDDAPDWLVGSDGTALMMIAVAMCLPFCLMTSLLWLEYASSVTTLILLVSTVWLVVRSIQLGLPALGRPGEFEIVGFSSLGKVMSATSTFGFIFFIQPIMMPMLDEVPKGKVGVRLLSWGTSITILGTAGIAYYACGFFGAAAFGKAAVDAGNFLKNNMGSPTAQGILNLFFTVYLVLSTPPFEFGTRHALDSFLMGLIPSAATNSAVRLLRSYVRTRRTVLALALYGTALGLAVSFPGKSAKVITITGAVGVSLVSYIIPIFNHFMLYFGVARCQRQLQDLEEDEQSVHRRLLAAHVVDSEDQRAQEHGVEEAQHTRVKIRNRASVKSRRKLHTTEFKHHTGVHVMECGMSNGTWRRPGSTPIPGGATDFVYFDPDQPASSLRSILTQVCLPILVLALGLLASIATLITL